MSNIYEQTGNRIHFYRKRAKLTISQLAEAIHRSKSTVSKYEQGSIAMDLETAQEIAGALNISLLQLIDFGVQPQRGRDSARARGSAFSSGAIYTYCHSGQRDKVQNGYIIQSADPMGGGDRAIYYDRIESFENYTNCEDIYVGSVQYFETLTRFELDHIENQMAKCMIVALNPFSPGDYAVGIRSGVSEVPIVPIAGKIVLSPFEITDRERILSLLTVSNQDIQIIRRTNFLFVNHR